MKTATLGLTLMMMGCVVASAATVNLDDYWNGSPSTLQASLNNAVNAAGNGGRVNLSAREYVSDKQLNIFRSVQIVGQGRWTSKVRRANNTWGPVFRVFANNVELNNFLVDGGVSRGDSIPDRTGVIYGGYSNFKLIGCAVFRCDYGIFNSGGSASSGLLVDNTHFVSNFNYGLWFHSLPSQPAPLNVGRMVCRNSYIANGTLMGINIDYGAEDRDSVFTSINMSAGGQRSLIQDCYIGNVREFGIAIARASYVDILDTTAFGGEVGGSSYTQALHLEDRLRYVSAKRCTFINNNNSAPGQNNFNSIIVMTSARNDRIEQFCRDVVIEDCTLSGTTKWGMEVVNSRDITIRNNNFSQVNVSGPKVNSWRRGENILLQGNTSLTRSEVSQGSGGFFSLPGGGWLNGNSTF